MVTNMLGLASGFFKSSRADSGFSRSLWGGSKAASAVKIDLSDLQDEMHGLMVGCTGEDVQRLGFKITAARKVSELWMLRSDAYQIIARQHSQSEAAKRINGVLTFFEGWIPASQLTHI
jgi:hypothetical protein